MQIEIKRFLKLYLVIVQEPVCVQCVFLYLCFVVLFVLRIEQNSLRQQHLP